MFTVNKSGLVLSILFVFTVCTTKTMEDKNKRKQESGFLEKVKSGINWYINTNPYAFVVKTGLTWKPHENSYLLPCNSKLISAIKDEKPYNVIKDILDSKASPNTLTKKIYQYCIMRLLNTAKKTLKLLCSCL